MNVFVCGGRSHDTEMQVFKKKKRKKKVDVFSLGVGNLIVFDIYVIEQLYADTVH